MSIVRKKTLEENNYDLRRVSVYPGTGPFRTKSVEPGVVRRLERNPAYWNPALPYLDGIEVFHLEFGPKTGAACLAHTIDFCWGIDPVSEQKAQRMKGLTTARIYPTTYWGSGSTSRTKPFDDVRVRRAVNLVLDKPGLIEAVSESVGTERAGWVLADRSVFSRILGESQGATGMALPHSRGSCRGQAPDAGRGVRPGIKGLDFVVRDIPFQLAWAPMVQDMLKRELKIESTIRPVASGVWYEEASSGHYDLTIHAYGVTLPHVADYWGNSFKSDGGYNFMPTRIQSSMPLWRQQPGSRIPRNCAAHRAGYSDPGPGHAEYRLLQCRTLPSPGGTMCRAMARPPRGPTSGRACGTKPGGWRNSL